MSPPFHAGKVHIMREQCKTCVFRPGNLMQLHPGRVAEMVRDAKEAESCIPCHSTIQGQQDQEAICRGFYDRHATIPLLLARSMGIIEEV